MTPLLLIKIKCGFYFAFGFCHWGIRCIPFSFLQCGSTMVDVEPTENESKLHGITPALVIEKYQNDNYYVLYTASSHIHSVWVWPNAIGGGGVGI